ncbi:MAG TPA: HepT-like ribonuclease domain-containing protein [Anaerolineales bacterium]|nr:HepT-like ribonuclease domain-containing protein [Anaerolineales bacterium]
MWDKREAAREIAEITKGTKFAQFEKNKTLRYAVERLLLVIGEAASHVSPQFRNSHSEVAWPYLIDLRNILAHEYGEMLINRDWLAATDAVPTLLKALQGLLPD